MFPLSAVFSLLGKRDFIYIAAIGALLIACFVGRAHYKGLIADALQEKAECLIVQTNLSNALQTATTKLTIAESNYTQCKAARIGLDAWVADYQKGCADSKTACEAQLTACINGKPAVPVNTKDGIRGITYEDGKASAKRVRDRLSGVAADGVH